MSLEVFWDKLDREMALMTQELLNSRFRSAARPDFIGELVCTHLDFGQRAPEIEIVDVSDPFPEFYLPDPGAVSAGVHSEDYFEQSGLHGHSNGAGASHYPEEGYDDEEEGEEEEEGRLQDWRTSSPVPYPAGPSTMPATMASMQAISVQSEHFHAAAADSEESLDDGQRQQHRAAWAATNVMAHAETTSLLSATATATRPTASPWAREHRQLATTTTHISDSAYEDEGDEAGSGSDPHLGMPTRPSIISTATPAAAVAEEHLYGPIKHDTDVQLQVRFAYDGDLQLTIATELRLNFPAAAFLSLPIELTITSFSFTGTAVVAYLSDRVNFCFLQPTEPGQSLIRDVRVESQIGDARKHVLKNVGKVERFVEDLLRRIVDEDLVFPCYSSVDLVGPGDDDAAGTEEDEDEDEEEEEEEALDEELGGDEQDTEDQSAEFGVPNQQTLLCANDNYCVEDGELAGVQESMRVAIGPFSHVMSHSLLVRDQYAVDRSGRSRRSAPLMHAMQGPMARLSPTLPSLIARSSTTAFGNVDPDSIDD